MSNTFTGMYIDARGRYPFIEDWLSNSPSFVNPFDSFTYSHRIIDRYIYDINNLLTYCNYKDADCLANALSQMINDYKNKLVMNRLSS